MSDTNPASENAVRCKHHDVCNRPEHTAGRGTCILHDPDLEKDRDAFDTALAEHREMLRKRGEAEKAAAGDAYEPQWELRDNFRHIVFPENVSFGGETFPDEGVDFFCATFGDRAWFEGATFGDEARFMRATFGDGARFEGTTFGDWALFWRATFGDGAWFEDATFGDRAHFGRATFGYEAWFEGAIFGDEAWLGGATLGGRAHFGGATFGDRVQFDNISFGDDLDFQGAQFEGRVSFTGKENDLLFSQTDSNATPVHFENADFRDRSGVVFHNVDLSRTRFLGVDVRGMEFTSIRWATIKGGNGVYDEIHAEESDDEIPYGALARLYRRLKQTYEDERDYGRGGDFHFREKEMQCRNPRTPRRNRVMLRLYRALSGYGERFYAIGWLLALVAVYTFVGLVLGLEVQTGGEWTLLEITDPLAFGQSLAHSLQVVLLRRPTGVQPVGWVGDVVRTLVMVLGPVLLALFALAVRQRLRR